MIHLQVVVLGAGLDTRAWRLTLPAGTAWFEVRTAAQTMLLHKHTYICIHTVSFALVNAANSWLNSLVGLIWFCTVTLKTRHQLQSAG